MKSLFLKKWNAFIRYNEIPGKGETVVYLPGLNLPARVSFFSTVMHHKLQGLNSFLIDYLGSGFSDYPKDFDHSIENHANAVAASCYWKAYTSKLCRKMYESYKIRTV